MFSTLSVTDNIYGKLKQKCSVSFFKTIKKIVG